MRSARSARLLGFAPALALSCLWAGSAEASGFSVARFSGEHGHPTTDNPTALVMQSDPTARCGMAATLRDLGFAVAEFTDEPHLYGHLIRVATAPKGDPRSFVILAEATADLLRDLEMLRTGSWPTPVVLVGPRADPAIARRLRAACLSCDEPTPAELEHAIDAALAASARN